MVVQVEKLLAREQARFLQQTPKSLAGLRSMAQYLPLGVASAYQSQPPYPVIVDKADGQWAHDIDGNKYLDLHAGFGANVFGHAHPQIVQAIKTQADLGAHYAHPTLELGRYTKTLCQRFGLEQVRLANSGNEATMEALRLARAYTGREKIIRFEGGYHGHHDLVMVSMKPDPKKVGDGPRPKPTASTLGISQGVLDDVVPLHFNDLATTQEVLAEGNIAAVIVEPIMCNLGLIRPQDGFLEGLRAACTQYGAVLIWDQVKTGGTVGWNGAAALYPQALPDLHCLGKMIGGGLPVGAYGGKQEIMSLISQGKVEGYGTFNGNPVTVAAGSAALEVMSRAAFEQLEKLNLELHAWLQQLIVRYNLPAYADCIGLKGGIFWAQQAPTNYREYLASVDHSMARLCQIWLANRGVLVAPGADEQWTLCCPMAKLIDLQLLTNALEDLAVELSPNFVE